MGIAAEALIWRFAVPDWEVRLREGRSLLPNLPLWQDEADRAVAIFNKLRLPDVPGQPMLADAAGEWQRDFVRAIFGSMDPATRYRHVGEIFGLVPKKNSKTTGGAAIMVTALLANDRPRAEFVLVGPTQEVADTAFQQASGMIDADEFLKTRFHIAEHTKTITDRLNKARLKIKTFDMKVATGSKPAGVLLDELHLMASMADAARVIGQLRGGMIANPEAFLIIITTQSDKPPAGAFKAELDYARAVRDGRITENVRLLPMLFEMSEAVQTSGRWRDPSLWPMVLPNLNRSITLTRLQAEYATARDKGKEEEQRWASQHLNIEIGLGLHDARWRGADYWKDRADRALTLEDLLARCEVAVVTADGGGLDDLFGLCVAGRERDTKRWLFWTRAWADKSVLELRKDIAARLIDFEADGDLVLYETPGDDLDDIIAVCCQVRDSGLMPETGAIGLDPAGVSVLVDRLAEEGFSLQSGEGRSQEVVSISQSATNMTSAIKGLERRLKDGSAAHAGQRLMDWCVGNAKIELRGNAVHMTKQMAGTAKIDPLIAVIMAAKLLSNNPVASAPAKAEVILL